MKVLFDHQIFGHQRFGGISRYFFELFTEFNKTKNINWANPLLFSENCYWKNENKFWIKRNFKGRKKLIRLLNSLFTIPYLLFSKFDIFHPTYFSTYFLPFLRKPFVLTVYDMIHETYPCLKKIDPKTIRKKRILIEKADKIIAISEYTKNEIIRLYSIPESKISVVYLAASFNLNDAKPILIHLPQRYILFTGNRQFYKNFNFMIEALTPLLESDLTLHVVCSGGGEWSDDEIDLLSRTKFFDRIHLYQSDDNFLIHLYSKALCFVFPSEAEGFGIPIIESWQCHCPVVLANSSCFPEIAEDAALYFDVGDKKQLLDQVTLLVSDESRRIEMVERGKKRATFFSWKKTAEETIRLYEDVLSV